MTVGFLNNSLASFIFIADTCSFKPYFYAYFNSLTVLLWLCRVLVILMLENFWTSFMSTEWEPVMTSSLSLGFLQR